VGSLDQWTDLSLFDSDILSAKARQAGFTLACCRDLFVHHFGTRTFAHGAPKTDTRVPS
jgi:O-antigen biosynthesis protein